MPVLLQLLTVVCVSLTTSLYIQREDLDDSILLRYYFCHLVQYLMASSSFSGNNFFSK